MKKVEEPNTRNKIIEVSKKYFYELGYSKTRMQDIAKESDIVIGSLTYHFKKKENIVSAILTEYLKRLYEYTLNHTKENLNHLQLHFYASIPFYKNLLIDEKVKRFFYEFTQAQSVHSTNYGGSELSDFITNVYHLSLKDYNIFVSPKYVNMAQKYGYGGRVQVIIDYIEGDLEGISIEEMSNFLSSAREMLMGIPKSELDRIGKEAIEFNNCVDFSHILPLK